jgi:D-methionine transport system substrate-binding protein
MRNRSLALAGACVNIVFYRQHPGQHIRPGEKMHRLILKTLPVLLLAASIATVHAQDKTRIKVGR